MSENDPEIIAKTIAHRQMQIEQLSGQLLDSLKKIDDLGISLDKLKEEKEELIKRLEKKNFMIKQESCDIQILKGKIERFQKRTWGDTFGGIRNWIGSKSPFGYWNRSRNSENK
jgi:chromosome segregation ATPase